MDDDHWHELCLRRACNGQPYWRPSVLLLQLLGVGSIAGAAMLIWTSTRSQPDRMIVLLVSLGNALWVIVFYGL